MKLRHVNLLLLITILVGLPAVLWWGIPGKITPPQPGLMPNSAWEQTSTAPMPVEAPVNLTPHPAAAPAPPTVEAPPPAQAVAPEPGLNADGTLAPQQISALVLIEGDYSKGSGFIAKLHDQYFVVTNQHVLSGNTKFTITGMDGTKYPTNGALYGAVGYDIAILRIPAAENALEVLKNPVLNAHRNDEVTVPGNEQGEGVATQTDGKLLGVGPKLVEVDAKFVHGNSGSPIILKSNAMVVGVATYVQVYDLDKLQQAADKEKTRWFGYRLDNVTQWQEIDWQKFSAEGVHLRQIEDETDAIIEVLSSDKPHPGNSESVNELLSLYESNRDQAIEHRNARELYAAIASLADGLGSLDEKDRQNFANQGLYDFHARELQDQIDLRTELKKKLQEAGDIFHDAEKHAY